MADTQNHFDHSSDLGRFITASPSSYHAAHEFAWRLTEAGFTEQDETESWSATKGGHYILRDGAVVAWWVADDATEDSGFRIVGAHTDSPGLKLKPAPDFDGLGYRRVAVETYGGLLANSWLNRDLAIAGRLTLRDGSTALAHTGAVMTIPQLAIHLDRKISAEGLKLDPQSHLQPLFHAAVEGTTPPSVLSVVADAAGIDADDVEGFDLVAADTQEPAHVGSEGQFLAAGRQDNLLSVHAGLRALEDIAAGGEASGVVVLAAFDHEEIGSQTRTGAGGPILETVLRRTAAALGAGSEEEFQRMMARSSCVSADCGHAVHPNYPERHDPTHRPVLGRGPLLKHNANQRYTTDAVGIALWKRASREAGVPVQDFVSNNSMPCGSTIGPITAGRLGIVTVDVGAPLLSMHSIREMSAAADSWGMYRVLTSYYAGA